MSLSLRRPSILLVCSVSLGAACLDLTPRRVPLPDVGSAEEAQQRCRECVYGANGPVPSCVDEMTRCTHSPACQSVLACAFENSCYGQDRSYALTCGTLCFDFVQRVDDPVVAILLPLYQCITDGPCAPACVPGQMGVGAASDGAATSSVGDASAGGACDNAEDQAIVSSGLTTAASSCGASCFTSATADCHIACIANQTGLSLACSVCWGETIQCSASRCLPQCLEPGSSACSDCNEQSCTPAFRSCSGAI